MKDIKEIIEVFVYQDGSQSFVDLTDPNHPKPIIDRAFWLIEHSLYWEDIP